MRGHLSFLSSDLLEGRLTPSRGLDVAAEYIAAQFRGAGLDPAGDDGYFQTAKFFDDKPDREGFELTLRHGERSITVAAANVDVHASRTADIQDATLYHAGSRKGHDAESMTAEQMKTSVAFAISEPEFEAARKLNPAPAAIVLVRRRPRDPREPTESLSEENRLADHDYPELIVYDKDVDDMVHGLRTGPSDWKVTLHVNASHVNAVKVRNVIGLLRGSDAALRDTYVLVTAHYDHLGLAPTGEDRVFNGANDDGSGTVSVMEIGAALAALPRRPRRSIVFMAVFGEEEGMLGSRYYVRHPLFPLEKTVADVNLEQLGRTDSTDGPQIANLTFSGFEYSDLPATFQKAGKATGINVYSLPNGGDDLFNRSDNFSFAEHGIPAHTCVVAVDFADYHGVGDEWQKIDYDNMAKVDRMLALGVLMIADNPAAPKWNRDKAAKYADSKP